MDTTPTAPGTIVKEHPQLGEGCYTTRRFRNGEQIEIAAAIEVPKNERTHLDQTAAYDYYFESRTTGAALIAISPISAMNHSSNPSASYIVHPTTIEVVAERDLDVGEEITVSYQQGVWFTPLPEIPEQ